MPYHIHEEVWFHFQSLLNSSCASKLIELLTTDKFVSTGRIKLSHLILSRQKYKRMNKNNQSTYDLARKIIHWIFIPYYVYEFGYASLAKITQYPYMMNSMSSLGFNKTWTVAIGSFELIGWIIFLIGLFKPKYRVIGILILMPFSIGAFTAHMSHQEYVNFYPSLIMIISSFVLLWSSENFKIKIIGD